MTKEQKFCLDDLEYNISKMLWNKIGNPSIDECLLFAEEWENNKEATKAAVQYLINKGIDFFVLSFECQEFTTFLMSGEYIMSYHIVIYMCDETLMVLDPLFFHEPITLDEWYESFCERLEGTATLALSDIITHNMLMENNSIASSVFDWVKDNCISKPSFICTNDVNHLGVSLEGDHMIRNWDLFGSMINCSSTKACEIYAPIYSSYIRTLLYSLTLDVDYSSKLKAVRDGVTKQINTEV